MKWHNLETWQKTILVTTLSVVIIIVFLYGYAFLYDYFYSKNFPQIPISTYATKFDPTKFSDPTASFIVEMANVLEKALS
jgi:hypothetical protein